MLEIVVICMVCCIDQETFDKKHSPVAHTVVKIISQFKAQTLSVRVGSGQRFRPGSISALYINDHFCCDVTLVLVNLADRCTGCT